MAKRTVCLCDGKFIGIESIFTVVDGKQINIPQKIEALRKKSREGKLLCACGCGCRLTLVAGDRNLREQHFRIYDGENEKGCEYKGEGMYSACSKIILKCWLDDKLPKSHIDMRVQMSHVSNTDRKFEVSFLVQEKMIAINYWYSRANILDEKIFSLSGSLNGIRLYYITDYSNRETNGQYPELMIKAQKQQGVCLFLKPAIRQNYTADYFESTLAVSYYVQEHGFWNLRDIVEDKLSAFTIDATGNILYSGRTLAILKAEHEDVKRREAEERMKAFKAKMEAEQRTREAAEKEKKAQKEVRLREIAKQQSARKLELEAERIAAKEAEKAAQKKHEDFTAGLASFFDIDREELCIDPQGARWLKCEYCGKIDEITNFNSYSGSSNFGICAGCSRKELPFVPPFRPQTRDRPPRQNTTPAEKSRTAGRPHSLMTCPKCGSELVKRIGRYGSFLGCKNYPSCRYTEALRCEMN